MFSVYIYVSEFKRTSYRNYQTLLNPSHKVGVKNIREICWKLLRTLLVVIFLRLTCISQEIFIVYFRSAPSFAHISEWSHDFIVVIKWARSDPRGKWSVLRLLLSFNKWLKWEIRWHRLPIQCTLKILTFL